MLNAIRDSGSQVPVAIFSGYPDEIIKYKEAAKIQNLYAFNKMTGVDALQLTLEQIINYFERNK